MVALVTPLYVRGSSGNMVALKYAVLLLVIRNDVNARNKMRKNVCSRREYGEKCYGRTQRWYFDYKDNICREFKDGYCGLVPNRFDTCEQCIRRCSDSDPNVSCTVPDGKKKG
nr:kunitz-type serine protease inhibitor vestiginin-2-like isoform X4 [Dermacentor andersoni]